MNSLESKHYDIVKVFATFLVVFAHVSRMYTGLGVVTPQYTSVGLANVTYVIYSFHMPLYMCVTGMVYGLCVFDLGKYKDRRVDFLRNKAKRLLIPYVCVGLFYVAPVMCLLNFTEQSYLRYCITGIILGGDSRHLWFISTLFCLFALCAVLDRWIFKFNSIVIFAILVGVSFCSNLIPNFFGVRNVLEYAQYFWFGVMIHKYSKQIRYKITNPMACIVMLSIYVVATITKIGVIRAYSAILFVFCILSYVNKDICNGNVFQEMKRNGFGIYLFHPMIIYVLFVFEKYISVNPYIFSGLVFVLSYVLSYGFTIAVRKAKLGFIIGE